MHSNNGCLKCIGQAGHIRRSAPNWFPSNSSLPRDECTFVRRTSARFSDATAVKNSAPPGAPSENISARTSGSLGIYHGNWTSHRRRSNSGADELACMADNCVPAVAAGLSGPTQTSLNASENCVRAQSIRPHVVTGIRRNSLPQNLVSDRRRNRMASFQGSDCGDRNMRLKYPEALSRLQK